MGHKLAGSAVSYPALGRRRPENRGDTTDPVCPLPGVADSTSAASQERSFGNSWNGRGRLGSMSAVKDWVAFLVCPDIPLQASSEVPFKKNRNVHQMSKPSSSQPLINGTGHA